MIRSYRLRRALLILAQHDTELAPIALAALVVLAAIITAAVTP